MSNAETRKNNKLPPKLIGTHGLLFWIVFFFTSTACAGVLDYHLLPETLRFKVSLDLRPYWDGIVNVNEVIVNLNGTVQIQDLSVADRGGRNWLTVKYAELSFKIDQKGFRFSELKIKRPRVILWYDKGDLSFPLDVNAFLETGDKPPAFMHFEQIQVEDAALTIASDETYTTLAGFNASAQRLGQTWDYIFGARCRKFQTLVDVNGFADIQNNNANFAVTAHHMLASQEAAVILSILQIPVINGATGRIAAKLQFNGRFDKEDILWPVGEVTLQNGTLNSTKGLLMSNFKMRLKSVGQRIVVQNMNADSFGGKFAGSAYMQSKANGTDYGGHFVFRDVSLDKVSELRGPSGYLSKGTAEATYAFTGTAEHFEDYRGHGVVFLDDADLWKMPLISKLFSFMGSSTLSYSDAVAAFKVNGPVITIQRANITSRLTAIELLSGSTLNYETQYIDGHAVFVPLKKVRTILLKIPILRLFVDVYDRLAGVSIRGYVWQPTSQLIRKEPINDIRKVTKSFFVSAANSGGQINRSTFRDMEQFFGMGSFDNPEKYDTDEQQQ